MDDSTARQRLYLLLAALFGQTPDREMALALQSRPLLEALESLLGLEPGVAPVLERLRSTPTAELAEDLAVEYTMLFSAPGAGMVVTCESAYRDKLVVDTPPQPEVGYPGGRRVYEGLYWGDSTVAVAGEYFVEGFDPGVEIPDSLAQELAFMAYLCGKEAGFLAEGNAAAAEAVAFRRHRFLKEHVSQWVPEFAARVRAKMPEGFFAVAALLAHEFVAAEAELSLSAENVFPTQLS